jgi:hypothetical protein
MTMYLVDGPRLLRRIYDLDRDSKCVCRMYDFNAQMIRINPALNTSRAGYSFGKCLFVAIGADLDTRRPAVAMLPVPADGAGGLRLR